MITCHEIVFSCWLSNRTHLIEFIFCSFTTSISCKYTWKVYHMAFTILLSVSKYYECIIFFFRSFTLIQFIWFSLISVSMTFSAFNSAGHLCNHVEVAPNHAGTTFIISNILVSIISFYFVLLETDSDLSI